MPKTDPDNPCVDQVADQVQALLREQGLEMELCVWHDPITAVMRGIRSDGSPAGHLRSIELGPSQEGEKASRS